MELRSGIRTRRKSYFIVLIYIFTEAPPRGKRGVAMNRRFFDDLLDSSTRRNKEGKRTLTLPVSIAVHVVILFAILVVPYLRYNELPEPALGTVRAFFVESEAAPPPPPPPPPAAKAAMAAPKISKPKPVIQEQPRFTPPIAVPK